MMMTWRRSMICVSLLFCLWLRVPQTMSWRAYVNWTKHFWKLLLARARFASRLVLDFVVVRLRNDWFVVRPSFRITWAIRQRKPLTRCVPRWWCHFEWTLRRVLLRRSISHERNSSKSTIGWSRTCQKEINTFKTLEISSVTLTLNPACIWVVSWSQCSWDVLILFS